MSDQITQPLKVKEAAQQLNVHVATIYRLIHSGQLEAERHGSRKGIRVTAESLNTYRAAAKIEQATTCECGFPAPSTEAVEVSR